MVQEEDIARGAMDALFAAMVRRYAEKTDDRGGDFVQHSTFVARRNVVAGVRNQQEDSDEDSEMAASVSQDRRPALAELDSEWEEAEAGDTETEGSEAEDI
jgi:hypothetical protein